MPAGTQAVPSAASISMSPSRSPSESSTPSVSHSGMKEWPAPATRTRCAAATMAQSSDSVFGRARLSGRAITLPDQFRHSAIRRPWVAIDNHPDYGRIQERLAEARA